MTARCNVPSVGDQHCPLGDEVPTEFVVHHGRVRDTKWEGRVPSHGLLDNGVDIGQRVSVAEVWQTVRADDCVELSVGFSENFGVEHYP